MPTPVRLGRRRLMRLVAPVLALAARGGMTPRAPHHVALPVGCLAGAQDAAQQTVARTANVVFVARKEATR
jgi:hypothetical protein